MDQTYTPIADHGAIGDLRTAALVGADGRIDWFCCPRFDSPSVFGAVLDAARGGHWTIAPAGRAGSRQFYLPDTNVLVTRFSAAGGVVEVTDLMPVLRPHDPDHRQRLVRRVSAVRGSLAMRSTLAPRFDYGRAEHTATPREGGVLLAGPGLTLVLTTELPVEVSDGDVTGAFTLDEGEVATFVLDVVPDTDPGQHPARGPAAPPADADALVTGTIAFWRAWVGRSRYAGRWRETVNRSALTLKLLTHEPSGAIVAAATMGLPEEIGGSRNWDYRHVWIRDAAFSLYALLRLGFTDEAEAFMDWLTDRFTAGDADADGDGPLRVVYDIDGRSTAGEEVLEHWEGHRGSFPVRVRNDAADQLQLDIYGELIDSIYLFNKHGKGISYDSWRSLQGVAAWLQENWDRPDEGIWEVRSGRRAHTFSRLMCWVALERMARMARQRGLPGDVADWSRTRDRIFADILERCWDPQLRAFVQSPGSGVLDASVLLMPMVKFLAPNDPRVVSTLAALEDVLVTDSLVFRYDPAAAPDGVDGAEGTFSMCSFWYVEALTRTGRLEDARLALEKMFTYANPLGLYAEQVGLTGEQLGNFPQAFTHLSLISAAINLDRALG
ncbi:MAG: GH15 [uncultured Quadrisphaera sp.]|uniref:GH15 n=1 Tax=uncultured Quadrisphaera sp. TaxID=904978 RepID=A0A6J4QGZ2_9ACTN|nr:MAG: GH15 [uncultured Quadrisphaera sp.]